MPTKIFTAAYIKELHDEYRASRRCLERVPDYLYGYAPHPKSMNMGYLTLLVAEIPLWIVYAIDKGEVDFATYKHFELSTTQALLDHYEENFKGAINALEKTTDEDLEKKFELRNKDQVLMSSSRKDSVASSINHWVHHRGQLTVYLRMNDIDVPSIYGPSADEKTF